MTAHLRWETYIHVGSLQDNSEPRKTIRDIGLQGRSDRDADRQRHDRRETSEVFGIDAHEQVIEQVGLLVRLQPLNR